MRCSRTVIVGFTVLAAVATLPVQASAQEELAIYVGQRVRIVSPQATGVFDLGGIVQDTLLLVRALGQAPNGLPALAIEWVPVEAIERLEVSLGGESRASGAKQGARAGFRVGKRMGRADARVRRRTYDIREISDELAAALEQAILGATLGTAAAAIGGVAGAVSSGEQWQAVLLPDRDTVSRGGIPE